MVRNELAASRQTVRCFANHEILRQWAQNDTELVSFRGTASCTRNLVVCRGGRQSRGRQQLATPAPWIGLAAAGHEITPVSLLEPPLDRQQIVERQRARTGQRQSQSRCPQE